MVKISGDIARIPTQDLRTAQAFNAFFFAPALRPDAIASNLFATHPTLQRRLDQLAEISAQLSDPGMSAP